MSRSGRAWGQVLLLCVMGTVVHARTATISTPAGPVEIDIGHIGPAGGLVTPAAPVAPRFGPPSIFSAPLPAGSGARAIGVAGAFTAEADDATAASWNPGGLTQLERAEASVVIRANTEANRHTSDNDDFRVGENDFDSSAVNYLSVVWPFRVANRNWVFSMNYQEAYDFQQEFTADLSSRSSSRQQSATSATYFETVTDTFDDGILELTITSHLETQADSILDQALRSDMVSSLEFQQEGTMDAVSPAIAVELTPKLSIGTAVNIYQNDLVGGEPIRTWTRAAYNGESASDADILTTRTTSGAFEYDGVLHLPGGGGLPPIDIPIDRTTGTYDPFTDTERTRRTDAVKFSGVYEERNTYDDLRGENVTIGVLCTINRFLGFGVTVDTGWSAKGTQTRLVKNTITTYAEDGFTAIDTTTTTQSETRRVEFNFPMYWSVGAVVRATHELHLLLDVSQTQWSDFWYQAEGSQRVNPLDGSPHGMNRLDDCWAVRAGIEYLLLTQHTEIPLRGGVAWEQRPAIGAPDEFWSVSVGSGISIGEDPGQLILDFAYIYMWGDDVLGSLVPDEDSMSSDVEKHQGFVSAIWHF